MIREPHIRRHLDTVAPSTFSKLKAWKAGTACALKLLWAGDPPLAPQAAAKLGDVIHNVMEAAGSNLDRDAAIRLWNQKSMEVDTKLHDNPVTRGLSPLSRSLRNYEVRRLMTIRMVCSLQGVSPSAGRATRVDRNYPLKEKPLQSLDGLIRGKIDLVEHRADGWVLVDYKSGDVTELDDDGSSHIKESYKVQLLLYAALLKEAQNITVQKAVLKTLDGDEHEVEIDSSRADEVACEARQLLNEFNSGVIGSEPERLGLPLPADRANHAFGCFDCLYRPKCPAYKAAKRISTDEKPWPRDAIGTVDEIIQNPQKTRVIIRSPDEPRQVIVDFSHSTDRHSLLGAIKSSDSIGIFDYVRGRAANYDGSRTCIYRME